MTQPKPPPQLHSGVASNNPADLSPATDSTGRTEDHFPPVIIDVPDPSESYLTRRGVLHCKKLASQHRSLAFSETRGMKPCPEKNALYKEIQACKDEEDELEKRLQEQFVPQHGPTQFLSPRAFFQCPLFSASNKAVGRADLVEFVLPSRGGQLGIRYSGPELRQSDGRVFLAILHMLRDVKVGTKVNIRPEQVCRAIFGRYDGKTRTQLRNHIQRLQKGLIVTEKFSVQLCLGFEYPQRGVWSVALDEHIVELFQMLPEVWFSIRLRLSLPEGLTSWLFSYIESQTNLIPMKISTIRTLCGSDSKELSFVNSLRLAMKAVAGAGIIDAGWSVREGEVRWLKKKPGTA